MTHSAEVILVNKDGTLTDEGMKIFLEGKLSPAQREALKEQALRQEVYGTQRQNALSANAIALD